MKYITRFLLYSLCILTACKNPVPDHSDQTNELSEDELMRISALIDPSPATYQDAQINDLIKIALNENWPVQRDPSGLIYWISDPGNEHRPQRTSTVQVRYKGRLTDGILFDQSPESGEPVTFNLSETIVAWQIAIPMIGEGGRVKILAHSDLAYKSRQIGDLIPSYSPLIFDVELINVNRE